MELDHSCVVAGAVYGIYRRWGVSKLFRYADQGQWDLVPERARRHPNETKFVHKYAPCDTALHRLLRPLHVVNKCPAMTSPNNNKATISASTSDDSNGEDWDHKYKFSTDVLTNQEFKLAKEKEHLLEIDPDMTKLLLNAVESILVANPNAASHANLFGRTPLHLACMELTPARAQAVMLLLKHSPQSARLQDHHGCTAMHYLMKNHPANQIPGELILKFLNIDELALERKNNNGQSPMDIFLVANCQEQDAVSGVREAEAVGLDICQLLRISTKLTSVDIVGEMVIE